MKRREKSNFKVFLMVYILILAIAMIGFLIYVVNSLITYENLQIDNYLNGIMNDVTKYADFSNLKFGKFESKDIDIKETIQEKINKNEITYKINSESVDLNNPVYDAYIDDKVICNIELNGQKKITRLGLLTFQEWKVNKITMQKEGLEYECEIEVPSGLKVSVNGVKVTESEKVSGGIDEGLVQLAEYSDIPYLVKYKINDLLKEPNIKIEYGNGKEALYEKEGNIFKVKLEYEKVEDEKKALAKIKGVIDIIEIAEDWSLYLTDDLGGKLHGFYNINQYLIKNSEMWNYAYKWATNVDITFISRHTLDNPTFTNEKVSNFEIYSENAFSCEVYLEKNMTIAGKTKMQDVMNEKMYFAYYEGEWKLVNMQSITKK